MSAQPPEAPAKKKFKMPDIYIVLVIFILLVTAFTYIILRDSTNAKPSRRRTARRRWW